MTTYTIRPIAKDDLDSLVALHGATYGMRDNSRADVRAYHERLLEHVLCDVRHGSPPVHSLVSVRDGEVVAMVYAAHNPMRHHDRRVWITAGTLLAIHPDHRNRECTEPFIRATLDCRGKLYIADRTNTEARRATQRLDHVRFYPQYSLRWGRVVNPATGALGGALNRSQRFGSRSTAALRRMTRALDKVVDRSGPELTAIDTSRARDRFTTTALRAEDLAAHGESVLQAFALRPDVTSAEQTELGWSRFRTLRSEGEFEKVAVWNDDGDLVGWYLLHTSPTGTAEVLQLVSRPRATADVIALVLQHAKDLGVGSVHGSASPSMIIPLSEAGAYYHGRSAAFLVGSDSDAVHATFASTSALVTGLESEYPTMLAPTSALTETLRPI